MIKKKILIIDDSALMRRMLCDIIQEDDRFEVADVAVDGAEGFKLIVSREYDAVVLDIYMPKMTGLQMLEELRKSNVHANVLVASTRTTEGAKETLDALELGAIDFITKPEGINGLRVREFHERFLNLLWTVSNVRAGSHINSITTDVVKKNYSIYNSSSRFASQGKTVGKKIVAIASSTGGPRALQEVIPVISSGIKAPIVLVQHMPAGFTRSLAERLDELSELTVKEAEEGEQIKNGHVYIAKGGCHLNVISQDGNYHLHFSDEPLREGVKPCANYMYESLIDSAFDEVICVVLTGMGCDGTEGIENLAKCKKTYVIAQDEETSTVYGMPKSIAHTGLVNEIVPLEQIADRIMKEVGVQ